MPIKTATKKWLYLLVIEHDSSFSSDFPAMFHFQRVFGPAFSMVNYGELVVVSHSIPYNLNLMKSLDSRCSISHRNPNGHSRSFNPIKSHTKSLFPKIFKSITNQPIPKNPTQTISKHPMLHHLRSFSEAFRRSLPPWAPVPTRRPWVLGFPPAAPAARRSSGSRTPPAPWKALGRRSWETPGTLLRNVDLISS